MKKIALFGVFTVFIALGLPVKAQAANGIVEFFFPSLRQEEVDPSDTLQAPFADLEAQEDKQVKKGALPENSLPLEQPHRDKGSIAKWLTSTVSEVTSFEAGKAATETESHKQFFVPAAQEQYAAFLNEMGLKKVLDSGRYSVGSFVEGEPRFLNEGVIGGRYRWIYEVPVMLSFMDKNMTDYKTANVTNQNLIITVQVGRTPDADNDAGILIDHWAAKSAKAAKK